MNKVKTKLQAERLFKEAEKMNTEFETSVESLSLYAEVLQLNPQHAESYNRIGHYYFQTGDYHIALANFREAELHDPKCRHVYWNIGTAMKVLYGPTKESLHFKMKSIKSNPDFYLNSPEFKGSLWDIPKPFITKMRRKLLKQQALPLLLLAGFGLSYTTQIAAYKGQVVCKPLALVE